MPKRIIFFIASILLCNIFLYNSSYADMYMSRSQQQFINFLLPQIETEDNKISIDRKQLLSLYHQHQAGKPLAASDQKWLNNLAQYYKVSNPNFSQKATWNNLLQRVDVVPASLSLAQAVYESAWGHSYIARRGNNYFGQMRDAYDGTHLKTYPSAKASVASYMHNLNTNRHYQQFRNTRAELRKRNEPVYGVNLARFLTMYSNNGYQYVAEVRSIIRDFDFTQYDDFQQFAQFQTQFSV